MYTIDFFAGIIAKKFNNIQNSIKKEAVGFLDFYLIFYFEMTSLTYLTCSSTEPTDVPPFDILLLTQVSRLISP